MIALANTAHEETNTRFRLAYHLLSEGFSVIPLLAGGKKPARKWKRYQTEYATVLDLKEWFIDNNYEPAIVTGQLSSITVIDCDNVNAIRQCIASGIGSLIQQKTKRGVHFVFRYNGERNTVRVNKIEGVDRRGEGGYVKAYADSELWTRATIETGEVIGATITKPTKATTASRIMMLAQRIKSQRHACMLWDWIDAQHNCEDLWLAMRTGCPWAFADVFDSNSIKWA